MYRLLLLLLCCPIWSIAQSDILEQKIEVDIRELPAREALRVIEQAASVRVVYASSLLPEPGGTVTLTKNPQTVAAALQAVFRRQTLHMEVVGRRIHLRAGEPEEASTFSLSGYVRDAESGEALVGATVHIADQSNTGAVTNAYGYFSLTLPQGSYRVYSSYLGYEPEEVGVALRSDQRISIDLKGLENELDEVVVVGHLETPFSRQTQMGAHRIAVQEWKNLPAIGGEPDVLKMVQLLPGVKSVGEGSSGMYVRGGNLDQNLILLDEAPIYNPSHLLGFFSVFNTDAVRHAELYKGNIPVQYGGRLSSVLDLRMREGNRERLGAEGSVGTLASRILLDGPLSESTSFMVSARRTYPDLFLKLLPDNGGNKLHFYDLNGKVNVRMNENNHLFLSGYYGRDAFRFFDKYENTWGNGTATLRWNHLFSEDMFANFSLIYSQYNYYIDHLIEGQSTFNWRTNVTDLNAKADVTWYQNPQSRFKFGANAILHRIDPGSETEGRLPGVGNQRGLESAIYAGHEWELSPKVSLAYGLRLVMYGNPDKNVVFQYDDEGQPVDSSSVGGWDHTTWDVVPRFSLSYQLNAKNALKASYSRTVQHLQELRNSSSPFSAFYIWVATSPSIPVQRADQISVGYYREEAERGLSFSVEAYYKWLDNQVDFVDHARLLQNPYLEREMRFGKGRAYGLEVLLQKTTGRFTGQVNYTYSRTLRSIQGINGGLEYPAYFDLPHEAGLTLQYELSPRWSLAANWQYASGKAVNLPEGGYRHEDTVIPIYRGRNGQRLPDYHRLDLSATLRRKDRQYQKNESYWVFSVQNAYFRKNPFSIDVLPYREPTTGNVPDPTDVAAYKTFLFGIVPSVSYNFSF